MIDRSFKTAVYALDGWMAPLWESRTVGRWMHVHAWDVALRDWIVCTVQYMWFLLASSWRTWRMRMSICVVFY